MALDIWLIGGSDSCAGAGIQKDLQTTVTLGANAGTVLTAVSAQSSDGVKSIEPVGMDMFVAQFACLLEMGLPRVIKSGLLTNIEHVHYLAAWLQAHPEVYYICDPVMVASSGDQLCADDIMKAIGNQLLVQANLVTLNVNEAAYFSGCNLTSATDFPDVAAVIKNHFGMRALVIKGGDLVTSDASDYFLDEEGHALCLSNPRLMGLSNAALHGTGCCFAAAIGATLAKGHSIHNAIVYAKAYLYNRLSASKVKNKIQPHGAVAMAPHFDRLPKVSRGKVEYHFGRCDKVKDIYCIIDRADWIKELAPSGIGIMQLRIKTIDPLLLKQEISQAIASANQYNIALYINDHWSLAIELGAYGVHLGQEDLAEADLNAIAQAGLKLGISTHDYYELARTLAIAPSYIALGPIYATTSKSMPFLPQGSEMIKHWRNLIGDIPLVAIGGIKCSDINRLIDEGADAVAMISHILAANNPLWTAYKCVKEALHHE